jgi:hypothetical protein
MFGVWARGVGGAAWKGALAGKRRRNRDAIAAKAIAGQPTSERDSTPRGGWLINRLLCAVVGHRRLGPTAAAAKLLPQGVQQELFFCLACSSYSWKNVSPSPNASWESVGV